MAYNFYNPYQYQQQMPQNQGVSFVSVRSIEEAYNYPVAPGNSITFKDENNPFVYTKTRGFSPLEQPVFEKYRLVKVDNVPQNTQEQPKSSSNADEQIKLLWDEVNAIKAKIKGAEHELTDD